MNTNERLWYFIGVMRGLGIGLMLMATLTAHKPALVGGIVAMLLSLLCEPTERAS